MNDSKTISMTQAELDATIAQAVTATVTTLQKAGALRAPGGGSAKGAGHGQVGRPATPGLEAFRIPADKGAGSLNLVSIMEIGTGWSPVGAGAPGKDDRDRRRGKALAPACYTPAALSMFRHGAPLAALRFNLAPAPVTAPKGVLGVLTPRVSPANAAILTPGNRAILQGLGLDPAAWLPVEPTVEVAAPVEPTVEVAAPVENVTPVETPAVSAAKPGKGDKRK